MASWTDDENVPSSNHWRGYAVNAPGPKALLGQHIDAYERFRDREHERDELDDRLADGRRAEDGWRASSSHSEGEGYW